MTTRRLTVSLLPFSLPRVKATTSLVALSLIVIPACSTTSTTSTPKPPTPARAAATQTPAPARIPTTTPDSVQPWTFETFQGSLIRTPHFSIYTTNTTPQIIDRLPTFMEGALTHYTTALVPLPRPDARMDTFLMATRAQWQRLTLRMLGERGVPVTYIDRGGFTHAGRAYLFDIGAADTLSIASHEGWHQFSQTTFKERLPLTLEEGIAAFMEGHRWLGPELVFLGWSNLERFDRLREAAARSGPAGLMSLHELLAGSPEVLLAKGPSGPLTFYSQAWALIHFLREGENGRYNDGFKRMVADAAGGHMSAFAAAQLRIKSLPLQPLAATRQLFRAYINPDLDALNREYQSYVRRIVETGARDAIVEGRSPLAPR